ncbi:MAG TPA: hypothetical protein PKA24_17395 [Microthrixaceae bacterium]|nr:hypothetical protein [Microthrixaceae bacterium]HMT62640.1 hypothetical protein [Microthrixaceae bacterium]
MIAAETTSRSRSELLAAIGEGELDGLERERFVAVTTIADGSVRRADLWWAPDLVAVQAYMDDDAAPARTRVLRGAGAADCLLAELLGRRDSDSGSLDLSSDGGGSMSSLIRSAVLTTRSCPGRLVVAGFEASGIVVAHDAQTRWATVTPDSTVDLREGELPALWVAIQDLTPAEVAADARSIRSRVSRSSEGH